jgi:hypothetical protein
MSILRRLWSGEDGFVISSELVLVATLMVMGMAVGLQTVRDAVVLELGDLAQAVGAANQSYSYAGITGHHSSTAGGSFADARDDCDRGSAQVRGGEANCIRVCTVAATPESF